MKKFVVLSLFVFLMASAAQAVPVLQLYIDGATYDDATETWVTSASSFDLYVIGKSLIDPNDVILSMALEGTADLPEAPDAAIGIDGVTYDYWVNGYAPMATYDTWDNSGDLPPHGIYPTWFTEFGLTSFGTAGLISDVNGDQGWFPTSGYASTGTDGWFQSYHIDISGEYAVHFDAFTLIDGEFGDKAPFSHTAGGQIPEPATMLLFGIGLAGAGVVRKLRKN